MCQSLLPLQILLHYLEKSPSRIFVAGINPNEGLQSPPSIRPLSSLGQWNSVRSPPFVKPLFIGLEEWDPTNYENSDMSSCNCGVEGSTAPYNSRSRPAAYPYLIPESKIRKVVVRKARMTMWIHSPRISPSPPWSWSSLYCAAKSDWWISDSEDNCPPDVVSLIFLDSFVSLERSQLVGNLQSAIPSIED